MTDQNRDQTPAAAKIQSEILRNLPQAIVELLITACSKLEIARGVHLVRRGDDADTLYFVVSGRFTVCSANGPIALITDGEPIGELAFLAGGKRTADVIAVRDSTVLALSRDAYFEISNKHPELAQALLVSVAGRLSKVTGISQTLSPEPGRITAIFPAAGCTLPVSFTTKLQASLAKGSGWPLYQETDATEQGAAPAELQAWIAEKEQTDGHIVLVASELSQSNPWTDAIIRMADVCIFVAQTDLDQTPDRTPCTLEASILNDSFPSNTHLVLLRDNLHTPIANTAAWLADRAVGLHHHVALDSQDCFARLERFIAGTATGLVLCGGGAFGSAHLGAIKAMQERGIVFDMAGGTSIGAAMAGVLAMGIDPANAIDICYDMFVRKKAMRRITAPVYSVLDPHLLDSQLQQHFVNCDVEDMPLNYFSAATSMTNNDLKVIRSGPVWRAIRASSALPAIFPPMVLEDGEILTDGGLLDNVPIAEMRKLKAGRNVIFNFDHGNNWRSQAKYDALPGRFGAIAMMLGLKRRLKPRFPGMMNILFRSMVVSARRLIRTTDLKDDIMIEIKPIRGMGFLDWKQAKKQFQTSYTEISHLLDQLDISADQDDMVAKIDKLAAHFAKEG